MGAHALSSCVRAQELERDAQSSHKECLGLQDQLGAALGQLKRSDERLELAEAALSALRREAAETAGTMAEVGWPLAPSARSIPGCCSSGKAWLLLALTGCHAGS